MSLGGGAVLFINNDPLNPGEGSSPLFVGMWLLLYSITFLWCFLLGFKVRKSQLLVFVIPAFMLLSSFWSLDFSKTFVYSLCFLFNVVFALQVVRYFALDQLLIFLSKIIIFMMVSGLVLYYIGFSNVIYFDVHDRETLIGGVPVRGLFNHKITAGIYSAFCFLLIVKYYDGLVKVLLLILTLYFNLKTGSATGVGILIFGLLLYSFNSLLLTMKIKAPVYIVSIIALVFFVISISVSYGTDLLEFFGRDPTLTGRTTLWTWGIETAFEKPVLGWGYVGYNGTNAAGLIADSFIEFSNYNVPHFHESYIQILVEGGLVVFLLYFSTIVFSIFYLFEFSSLVRNKRSTLICLSILMSILVSAGFVHVLSRYNNFTTIFVFLTFLYSLKFHEEIRSCRYDS